MDRTIKDLKIGTRLQFGRYTCSQDPMDTGSPIIWLKATPNCDFISEHALDHLCFDTGEDGSANRGHIWYGNNSYGLSNILQYLNSDEAAWFHKMHEHDKAPSYRNHPGFLYNFEEFEIEALVNGMRLPAPEDIYGASRFPLFNRKGVRPRGSDDFLMYHRHEYSDTAYVEFWTSEQVDNSTRVYIVNREGYEGSCEPANRSGLRPVCRIRGCLTVDITAAGIYTLRPFEIAETEEIYSDDDLFSFLGLR